MVNNKLLMIAPNTEIIETSGVDCMLNQIRPEWQARNMVERIGRRAPGRAEIRVALAAGILAYLKRGQIREFFQDNFELMKSTSFRWASHTIHGELYRACLLIFSSICISKKLHEVGCQD